MKVNRINMTMLSILLGAQFPCYALTKTFYSLSRAEAFEDTQKGDYFIQMGNFSQQMNAIEFERRLKNTINFPVAIHHAHKNFIVIVGPMHTAAEVQQASRQLSKLQRNTTLHTPINKPIVAPIVAFKDTIFHAEEDTKMGAVESPWFVGLGAGVQQLNVVNPMYISNGSNFAYPYNYDQYSTQTNAQTVIAAELGYRWKNDYQWIPGQKLFPGYTLSFYYNHLFTTNIGDQIEQYSIPEFTNYRYKWDVSADVFFALAKLNLIEYQQFSPFFQVGIGGSLNHANQYSEKAYPNVTKRISPAYADNTSGSFAYDLGAGIDWQVNKAFSISILYQFQDLGTVQSGAGATTWRSDSLKSSTYQTNLALLKADYYFSF